MSPAQIKKKYAKRIMAYLNFARTKLIEADIKGVGKPFDMSCEEYKWALVITTGKGQDELIDITFEINESEIYDGEVGGVNFSLDIVEAGGRILGGVTPFNYTNKCWVSRKDIGAIEDRFQLLENSDCSGIVDCVMKSKLLNSKKRKSK